MTYKISQTENKEYIYDFLEPVSNNASSTSPFNVTFIGYFDFLLFWYFDILFNNCPHFSQGCFFNSNFQVAHICFLCHIFFSVSKPKSDLTDKIFIENQLEIKTSQLTGSKTVCPIKCLSLKIGAYIFLRC